MWIPRRLLQPAHGQARVDRLGGPAVRPEVASMVVDSLKGGQFMFSWYPDDHWLASSTLINCPHRTEKGLVAARD